MNAGRSGWVIKPTHVLGWPVCSYSWPGDRRYLPRPVGLAHALKLHLRLASGYRTALHTVLRRVRFLIINLWATSQKNSPHWRYCLSPRGHFKVWSSPCTEEKVLSVALSLPKCVSHRIVGEASPTSKLSAGLNNLDFWCHQQKY